MYKILIIDDVRNFELDPIVMGEHEITYARTSEEGINLLPQEKWGQVWLDHDLGGEDTIEPVVDYIIKNKDDFLLTIENIFVHSMNTVAQERIVDQLSNSTDIYVYAVSLFHDHSAYMKVTYNEPLVLSESHEDGF